MFICVPFYVPGVCGGYKRPSDTQELELWVGVSCCVSAGFSGRAVAVILTPELALQPCNKTIKFFKLLLCASLFTFCLVNVCHIMHLEIRGHLSRVSSFFHQTGLEFRLSGLLKMFLFLLSHPTIPIFLYVDELFCLHVYTVCVPGACRGQERALNALQLELKGL